MIEPDGEQPYGPPTPSHRQGEDEEEEEDEFIYLKDSLFIINQKST